MKIVIENKDCDQPNGLGNRSRSNFSGFLIRTVGFEGYAYQFGSDGEAVGDAVFDDGDGLTSPIEGLLAGVFGDVEWCDIGCGLSGILKYDLHLFSFLFQKKKSLFFLFSSQILL